jgi:hypothetical protein
VRLKLCGPDAHQSPTRQDVVEVGPSFAMPQSDVDVKPPLRMCCPAGQLLSNVATFGGVTLFTGPWTMLSFVASNPDGGE